VKVSQFHDILALTQDQKLDMLSMVIISSYLITLVTKHNIATVIQLFMVFYPRVKQKSVKSELILATSGLFFVTGHPVHTDGVRGIKYCQNLFHSYLILGTEFGSNQRLLLLEYFAWFLERQELNYLYQKIYQSLSQRRWHHVQLTQFL
jgi:hypothetical protein